MLRILHRVALVTLPLLWGCSSGPAAFTPLDIDAVDATEKAFDLYDENRDGVLELTELEACPGVLAQIEVYDRNKDSKIDNDEMIARIEAWASSPPMMSLNCRVSLDGRPLEGARVLYEPEPYLADVLPAAEGVSKGLGVAAIGISTEQLDPGQRGVRAIRPGVYKIRVTHPTIAIPARYNVSTTLGREMSNETRPAVEDLSLKTKANP